VVFAAGGQLTYGAVHGICSGSKLPVHHPKPQHYKCCGTDDGNHTGDNVSQASIPPSSYLADCLKQIFQTLL